MSDVLDIVVNYLSKNDMITCVILGGSRSKGYSTPKSDYDLFLLIEDDDYRSFCNQFICFLEDSDLFDAATYYSYVEDWGYIYKAIGHKNVKSIQFDFTVLPLRRSDEMALRSTNILLFDRYGVASDLLKRYADRIYDIAALEQRRRQDYVKLFGFEHLRFRRSIDSKDYWLAIKAIERMRTYYLHYRRIAENEYATNPHCPEKGFSNTFPDDPLWDVYLVSGDGMTLRMTEEKMYRLFHEMVDEKEVLDCFWDRS